MFRRSYYFVVIALMLAIFVASPAAAQRWMSTDLLLPYFEVDVSNLDRTTMFSVVNSFDESVSIEIAVHSNWGIEVLSVPLTLEAQSLISVNLVDWLGLGSLPNKTLSAGELETLQNALLGWQGPEDWKYYASLVPDVNAVGYITIRIKGVQRPPSLFGDFFLVDPSRECSQGEQLVDISPDVGCGETCQRHSLRFLNKDLEDATHFIVWSDVQGEASLDSYAIDEHLIAADIRIFSSDGRMVNHRTKGLRPLEMVSFDEFEIEEDFGWIDIYTEVDTFIAVRFRSKDHFSVALQTTCSWLPYGSGFPASEGGLVIEKYTNGLNADRAPGKRILYGEAIEWTYRVTNNTFKRIENISVLDDDDLLEVDCPLTVLEEGESMICVARGFAENQDDECHYKNIGSVFGFTEDGITMADSDESHYYAYEEVELDVDLKLNGEDFLSLPGASVMSDEDVEWSYLVTNSGNASLGRINVEDFLGNRIQCPQSTLRARETMLCFAEGNVPVGDNRNVATATGYSTRCQSFTSSEDFTYVSSVAPDVNIDVEKATNGEDADELRGPEINVGSPVEWTYVVSNTGNVDLIEVDLSDNKVKSVSCPKMSLVAGESMVCTASGIAIRGQYRNEAWVRGSSKSGIQVEDRDPSHYFGVKPAIDLEKLTNGLDADIPAAAARIPVGSVVTWRYLVENTGNVELKKINLKDDVLGPIECPSSYLDAGETMVCSAQGEAILGLYRNIGSVVAYDSSEREVSDSDPSHYRGTNSAIDLEKATNGEDADDPVGPRILVGDKVTWTYEVRNIGTEELDKIEVTDDKIGIIECPRNRLDAGESMVCEAEGTAELGQYRNDSWVSGMTWNNVKVGDRDPSHYLGVEMGIDIEKTTNGEDADEATGPEILAGDEVIWTYVVKNTGSVDLIEITVIDDKIGEIDCPKSRLGIGETMTCTEIGEAIVGQYRNEAVATGWNDDGAEVSDSDPSHYYGVTMGITIEKATNGEDADEATGPEILAGDQVTWTYVVTNTGTAELINITVVDDKIGTVECPQNTLEAGASMTCTETGIAVVGQYRNEALATGWNEVGAEVSDSDPSHYYGFIDDDEDEGCTHGYWKNHEQTWAPTGYNPEMLLSDVFHSTEAFEDIASATMMEGMKFKGGEDLEAAVRILMIQAVAALLDATHPDVNYPRTEDQVIAETNDAIDSMDRDTILAVKDSFYEDNNIGCPL